MGEWPLHTGCAYYIQQKNKQLRDLQRVKFLQAFHGSVLVPVCSDFATVKYCLSGESLRSSKYMFKFIQCVLKVVN